VMAFPTIVTAFENRAIEGAVVTEPYVTAIMERGNAVILSSSKDTVPDFPTPIFFGPSILDKNKDVGKRFMVAYLKGVRAYNLGEDREKCRDRPELYRDGSRLDPEGLLACGERVRLCTPGACDGVSGLAVQP